MKRQHFLALGALVVVLLGLRLGLSHRRSGSAVTLGDAGVHRVLPHADVAAVTWVDVSSPPPAPAGDGAAPAEAPTRVRLEKRDGTWVVATLGGAPADDAAVTAFVGRAASLAGEVRGRGEAARASFGVTPEQAVRVELGGEGGTAGTMYVGKTGDRPSSHFVHADGTNEVLHVATGLREMLGLWGESSSVAKDLWLRKEILGLKGEDVARVTIDRPDFRVVLSKGAPPAPPEGGDPAPPAWTVEEPALPWPVNGGLASVVDRLASVRVASALDAAAPECAAEPVATLTIATTAGVETIVRVRGAVEGKEDVALTIDGQPHCWSMSTWGLGTLLPRASAIWDVPALLPDVAGEPSRVRLERGGAAAVATKSGDEWKVSGAGLDAAKAPAVASSIRFLRIEDVALESAADPAPHATVSATFGGATRTVRILGARPGGTGERYARADGATLPPGLILVLPKATVDALTPVPTTTER